MAWTVVWQIGPVDGAIKYQCPTGGLELGEVLALGRWHRPLVSAVFRSDQLREALRREGADDVASVKDLLFPVWSFNAKLPA